MSTYSRPPAAAAASPHWREGIDSRSRRIQRGERKETHQSCLRREGQLESVIFGEKDNKRNIQLRARNESNVIVQTRIERRDKHQKRKRTANTGRMAKLELLLALTEGTKGVEVMEEVGPEGEAGTTCGCQR